MDYEAELKNNNQNPANWGDMDASQVNRNPANLGRQAIFSNPMEGDSADNLASVINDAPINQSRDNISANVLEDIPTMPDNPFAPPIPPLGEIVDATPKTEPRPTELDTSAFVPAGDHLSPRAVAAVDNLITQTRDENKSLSNIYNDISAARSAFLENSGLKGGEK